eukprot:CAMPEP_0201869250 /NCGR_PEP_ID=MMETSP0902-20130614/2832_1 /ASSEMBLY_ACC=CAM_ASM_000551 /TAXON_ID=420261 /ORGANISM="Thalassiosira antarctica, Strain CCMP982" /LENGTH=321 /DNA_ID=CAMNT_0048394721 /DNA_START=67 /DNA_END=1028 /DNA_ORIENTATION=+
MSRPKTAVIIGATNGIGKAIACRLAQEGFQIIAVGRDKEGRKSEVLGFLEECSASNGGESKDDKECTIKHEFRACNAFELAQVKTCAQDIVRDYSTDDKGIDALVMTQGMATIQNFTPTSEGNDQKLTLHYWSRAAFANCLLPALRTPSIMPGGPVVMTLLSGGVHSPYAKYKEDPELKQKYSIPKAADSAGYYTDLFFDKLARQQPNESINFIHAAPGFVASNWGTEMPVWIRAPTRAMQKLMGKSPEKCADFMVRPILQCADGKIALNLPEQPGSSPQPNRGLYIMKQDGTSGKLTKDHTVEAMDSVWGTTKDVLGRAG